MITPFSVPWVAVIEDFDVTTAEEDELALLAKDCFLKCPVIVFRKQPETTTAKQFFEFVQKFDPDVDMDAIENEVFLRPFRRKPDAPHVASREENKSTTEIEALETDGILLGRSWLTLGDSLGSSEGEHKGKVVDSMLLTLGLKVGTSEGAREGKTEGKAEAKATDGDWLGHPSPNRIDVSDLPNSQPSAIW